MSQLDTAAGGSGTASSKIARTYGYCQGVTAKSGFSRSRVARPIPGTSSKASRFGNRPRSLRQRTIASARAGPMPGRSCNCSAVARFKSNCSCHLPRDSGCPDLPPPLAVARTPDRSGERRPDTRQPVQFDLACQVRVDLLARLQGLFSPLGFLEGRLGDGQRRIDIRRRRQPTSLHFSRLRLDDDSTERRQQHEERTRQQRLGFPLRERHAVPRPFSSHSSPIQHAQTIASSAQQILNPSR